MGKAMSRVAGDGRPSPSKQDSWEGRKGPPSNGNQQSKAQEGERWRGDELRRITKFIDAGPSARARIRLAALYSPEELIKKERKKEKRKKRKKEKKNLQSIGNHNPTIFFAALNPSRLMAHRMTKTTTGNRRISVWCRKGSATEFSKKFRLRGRRCIPL